MIVSVMCEGIVYIILEIGTSVIGLSTMKYAVIIEKGELSYGAYVPYLPGCVAVGDSEDEVRHLIHEAVEFHLEGMREENLPIPEPVSVVETVDVP
jgi:predicted RNase H-like HicB family nuclease